MPLTRKTLVAAGLFVAGGFALAMLSVFMIGRERGFFQSKYTLIAPFNDISGLRRGAVVQLSGINVGYVEGVRFPADQKARMLEVLLKINTRFQNQIRGDSVATIQTQGLLGDKYILITRGSGAFPPLKDSDRIQAAGFGGLTDLSQKGGKMMEELSLTAVRLRQALEKIPLDPKNEQSVEAILHNLEGVSADLKTILSGLREGEGTLGGLLKDPSLYHDLRALMGHANRSKLLKNLIRATISEQEKSTRQPLD